MGLDQRADDVEPQAQALLAVPVGGRARTARRSGPGPPGRSRRPGPRPPAVADSLVGRGRRTTTGRPAPYFRALESRLPTTCSSLQPVEAADDRPARLDRRSPTPASAWPGSRNRATTSRTSSQRSSASRSSWTRPLLIRATSSMFSIIRPSRSPCRLLTSRRWRTSAGTGPCSLGAAGAPRPTAGARRAGPSARGWRTRRTRPGPQVTAPQLLLRLLLFRDVQEREHREGGPAIGGGEGAAVDLEAERPPRTCQAISAPSTAVAAAGKWRRGPRGRCGPRPVPQSAPRHRPHRRAGRGRCSEPPDCRGRPWTIQVNDERRERLQVEHEFQPSPFVVTRRPRNGGFWLAPGHPSSKPPRPDDPIGTCAE